MAGFHVADVTLNRQSFCFLPPEYWDYSVPGPPRLIYAVLGTEPMAGEPPPNIPIPQQFSCSGLALALAVYLVNSSVKIERREKKKRVGDLAQ